MRARGFVREGQPGSSGRARRDTAYRAFHDDLDARIIEGVRRRKVQQNRPDGRASGPASLLVGCVLVLGCGGSGGDPGSDCSANQRIAGVCAGVPDQPLCSSDPCTDGIHCSKVVSASTDAELTSALDGAGPGTCVAVAPGTYQRATVPAGVALLGMSAADVHIASVVLASGQGAKVRGIEVGSAGLELGSARAFVIDGVRVASASGDGIHAGSGASSTISRSTVDASTRYGIELVDTGSIGIQTTQVTGSKGPGLRAECTGGCGCSAGMKLDVASSGIKQSGLVGVSLVGVDTTFNGVDVTDNAVGADFKPSGGIFVSACSSLVASGVRVLDNSSFGLMVNQSSATFGKPGTDAAVEVSRNFIGVSIQKTDAHQHVTLDNCTLADNSGVSIGVDGAANGIIIHDSHVSNTKLVDLPALASDGTPVGSKSVGDGLNWLGKSSLQIDGLDLSGDARASVLIDGEVGAHSSIAHVTLSGGDASKGVLEQAFPNGGVAPAVGAGAPPLQKRATSTFAIPAGPAAPASL